VIFVGVEKGLNVMRAFGTLGNATLCKTVILLQFCSNVSPFWCTIHSHRSVERNRS